MIDDAVTREVRRAWREDPRRVVLASLATVAAVPLLWVAVIVFIVLGGGLPE